MEFICTVGTAEGKVLQEQLAARSEEAARHELERRGLHVLSIRRRGLAVPQALKRLPRRQKRIPQRTLMIFNQEFAALLKAGLPILQAIEMMHERQSDPLFKEVLGEIRRRVRDGEDFSAAVGSFGELFPPLYGPTLKAGEQSGELEGVLRRFLRYQKLTGEARRRLVSALVYPLVLIGLSLGLILVMTVYVVPKFREFYSALSADLPFLTRAMLGLSSFMSRYWLAAGLFVVAGALAWRGWSQTRHGALFKDRLKTLVPIVGRIVQRLAMSEFCRSLSTLLAGGIPAVPALESSVAAVGNSYMRSRLEPMIPKIREGTALHESLADSGVSPEIAVEMAKVGEETGSLDVMMSNASDFLDEEIDTHIQRLLTLIEPIMLVLMGVIVATLLVAVYLPLFSMLGEVRE